MKFVLLHPRGEKDQDVQSEASKDLPNVKLNGKHCGMEVCTQGVRLLMLAAVLLARGHAEVAWSSRDGGLPSVF